MGKFGSNGPDWYDVAELMTALRVYSGGFTSLSLVPAPTLGSGAMRMTSTLLVTSVVCPTKDDMIHSTLIWPDRRWRYLESAAMFTLYDLDRQLAQHRFFKEEQSDG